MADSTVVNVNPNIKVTDNADNTWSVSVEDVNSDDALTALQTLAAAGAAYNAPVELIAASDIGAADGTWIDQGAEIDCRGYNTITIWMDLVVNDSTGNQLQVLCKHTTAGVTEYVLETAAEYQKTIGDANINIAYTFELDNAIPYIQLQTRATDVAVAPAVVEGTVTINYVLGNK